MTLPAAKTVLGLNSGTLLALAGSVMLHGVVLFAIPLAPQAGSAQPHVLQAQLLTITAAKSSAAAQRQTALHQPTASTPAADNMPPPLAAADDMAAAPGAAAAALSEQSSYFSREQLDVPPHLLGEVQQVYPARARMAAVEGHVTLALLINERGEVEDASVVQAQPAGYFEEAALSMLRKQRFSPPLWQNLPVKSRWLTTVRYRLQG